MKAMKTLDHLLAHEQTSGPRANPRRRKAANEKLTQIATEHVNEEAVAGTA